MTKRPIGLIVTALAGISFARPSLACAEGLGATGLLALGWLLLLITLISCVLFPVLLFLSRLFSRKVPMKSLFRVTLLVSCACGASLLLILGPSRPIGSFCAGKVDSTKIQMKLLQIVLDDFQKACGFYPNTEQGLAALIKKPTQGPDCVKYPEAAFLKGRKLPKDAWGNDFIYSSDGKSYSIMSTGADEKPGGDGLERDIRSDDL